MEPSTFSAPAGRSQLRHRWLRAIVLGLASLALLPATLARQAEDDADASPQQKAVRDIAIAEATARRVTQLSRHPDFGAAARRDAELKTSLDRGQRLLSVAQSGLKSAEQRQSATGFADAALLARRAARQFDAYEERLQEVFRQIEMERSPPPPPPPPPSAAEEPPPAVAPPPPPRRRSPPAKLRQAADAYFAGDYEQTVALVSGTTFSKGKTRAHAFLLSAAARYALFLLGGESDYALRGLATEDVGACRRADPDLLPSEEMFSPRFRDFFAATR